MLVRIVCLLMELLKLQGYRSRVLHVSASRSDRYRVALRDLLEGRITTSTHPVMMAPARVQMSSKSNEASLLRRRPCRLIRPTPKNGIRSKAKLKGASLRPIDGTPAWRMQRLDGYRYRLFATVGRNR